MGRIVATDPSPGNHRESVADEISQFQELRRKLILRGENASASAASVGCVKRTSRETHHEMFDRCVARTLLIRRDEFH